MAASAAKRDDLVTVLLERLDRFEAQLSQMRETLARMEAGEEQQRTTANELRRHIEEHDSRITALETGVHRAQGAAWAGKMFWAAGIALAGAVSAVVHYVLK